MEALFVLALYKEMLTNIAELREHKASVAVISPYKAQVSSAPRPLAGTVLWLAGPVFRLCAECQTPNTVCDLAHSAVAIVRQATNGLQQHMAS